jgi:hypothetical protein
MTLELASILFILSLSTSIVASEQTLLQYSVLPSNIYASDTGSLEQVVYVTLVAPVTTNAIGQVVFCFLQGSGAGNLTETEFDAFTAIGTS